MNISDASDQEQSGPDHCERPALFGPPPLFEGEEGSYHQLLTKISRTVMPEDIFEEIWVRDFVDLTIAVLRLRRLKVSLIAANEYKGLSEALRPLVGCLQADTLAQGWAARKSDVVEGVKKTLRSAGLGTDSILAQTFSLKLNEIERIEQMMALAEARRNAALHEIDRHRQTLGQKLRRAAQHLEDGQFRVIESTPTSMDGTRVE